MKKRTETTQDEYLVASIKFNGMRKSYSCRSGNGEKVQCQTIGQVRNYFLSAPNRHIIAALTHALKIIVSLIRFSFSPFRKICGCDMNIFVKPP